MKTRDHTGRIAPRRAGIATLLLIAALAGCVRPAAGPCPPEWWAPVPRESAASWEILPQDAGPGEVILSKRTELGILSNFAPTPFTLDGETYASVEGFWQMLKYPEGPGDERLRDPSVAWPHTREEVGRMSAFEAKAAGTAANGNMKKLGIRWVTYRGQRLEYSEKRQGEFYRLIRAAMQAKLEQNPEVRAVLLKTGGLILRPDHHQRPDDSPAMKYYDIWMELRDTL
ncbi:MAG TPA: NADAR family protein [Kiritimatiellia bacterium]|nr:NADAR family protein [Kiritimatiellia bacterium]HRZ11327.1 NADAR family protein [Kiritimatiellia bacterium]HSA17122.1 NADAR family protein [Kiritimatiellia bacterium]